MTRIVATPLLLLLLLLQGPAASADIYKWQDEDGRWHFSDRKPDDAQPFESLDMPQETRAMVTARRGGERHRPEHFFFNRYHGPAEIELRLSHADNVQPQPTLPARFVLPANQEVGLVQFGPLDPAESFSYRLAYTLVPGAPANGLPEDLEFFPPFARGQTFPISQGLDDDQTHSDAANRYAVDIVMPIGTPVLAARGGVVMETEDGHSDNGKKDESYLDRANFIRVHHDDGTMAVYAHLQQHSVRVRPGMKIPAGHWIGNSGNSGFSSGPHLHFVVQLNIGMALESLPLGFRRPEGGVMDPDRPQLLHGVLAYRP